MVKRRWLAVVLVLLCLILSGAFLMTRDLEHKYEKLESRSVHDRNGNVIAFLMNEKSNYASLNNEIPERVRDLIIRKEDRFFFYHPGINPVSFSGAAFLKILTGQNRRSSTITQQLVKNLLGHEKRRTVINKLIETAYALSLELFTSKKIIFQMYADSVYLGNQIQGFALASRAYYGKDISTLNDKETLALLATLPSPSALNPRSANIEQRLKILAQNLDVQIDEDPLAVLKHQDSGIIAREFFELAPLIKDCAADCRLTVDQKLSAKLRDILDRNIGELGAYGAKNGAIVAFKEPGHELLALIGSPDPGKDTDGSRINMALKPRSIGSTGKPFITLLGFMRGLRPYTLVDDREYKYMLANNYPLYPKNYDGIYYGRVTIREALANSLNVPFVKILEFTTLEKMYTFLSGNLGFTPLRDFENYQYGIALGSLEMDLLSLTHLYSIFPNEGVLKPTVFIADQPQTPLLPPMVKTKTAQRVAAPDYIQLVNRILSDRNAGVHEFGLKSDLNLTFQNYGVKTGTSRDYHDSWTVGYTPSLVVGVWLGNAENKPLDKISGVTGAARIWNEAITAAVNMGYGTAKQFSQDLTRDFPNADYVDIGLRSDDPDDFRDILLAESNQLIVMPHNGDVFRGGDTTTIPLKSDNIVSWYIDGAYWGTAKEVSYQPTRAGSYIIEARSAGGDKEKLSISVVY